MPSPSHAQPRVKICGITRLEDAQAAARFGADALGFIFAKSPRQITAKKARAISRQLGPFVTRVGVFVNAPARTILKTMEEARLDVIQLHGDETPALSAQLAAQYPVIKVFRVTSDFSPEKMKTYAVHAHMLETAAHVAGGSGQTWDWSRLAKAHWTAPLIVTGGLRPSNVQKAIQVLRPYAVDVSSGVEAKPGIKDLKLMESFIRHAKTTR